MANGVVEHQHALAPGHHLGNVEHRRTVASLVEGQLLAGLEVQALAEVFEPRCPPGRSPRRRHRCPHVEAGPAASARRSRPSPTGCSAAGAGDDLGLAAEQFDGFLLSYCAARSGGCGCSSDPRLAAHLHLALLADRRDIVGAARTGRAATGARRTTPPGSQRTADEPATTRKPRRDLRHGRRLQRQSGGTAECLPEIARLDERSQVLRAARTPLAEAPRRPGDASGVRADHPGVRFVAKVAGFIGGGV